jgi:hypothetical protein
VGLTGRLKDGTEITKIPYCEFEAPGLDEHGEVGPCDEPARYRVLFLTGELLHACAEHAQNLWDADAAFVEEDEPALATNAVDPVAQPSGTPTPREASSSSSPEGVSRSPVKETER